VLRSWVFILIFSGAVAQFCAIAQTAQAAVSGTVRDPDGRAVPETTIEVRQPQTGWIRRTQTGSAGTYSITELPIGSYSVSVSHPGFGTSQANVELLVGQERTLDFGLLLAGHAVQVNVTSSVSEIDQTSAAVQGRMVQKQIEGLPLNGRNWSNLLPLIPGATDSGTSDQRTVRFAGHGRDDNNITFDGVDATGISNQPQKTGIRLAIPASTINEFKVDSTLYTADSADGTGGQMVLASTGGTNVFHGELFEFLRNDVFDARNPFATRKQPFGLNQFGANVGGPVVRNKTFFFVAFEAYRQRLDQALTGFTPSASYRARALEQSPELAPLISAYPTGTAAQAGNPDIDKFTGLSPQRGDENSGMVRIDHRFSPGISAFLRVNVDEGVSDVPLNNLKDRQVVDNRPINGVLNVSQVLSPRVLNETKVGFNQVFSRTTNLTGVPYTLQVSGFTPMNAAQTREEDDTSVSLIDNVSWTVGRHTFKAGVEGRRVYMDPASSASGTLTYTNPATFLANQMNTASVTDPLPLKRLRKNQAFGFVQDEFKVTPNFTLNLGLRYQFFNVFHEADGRAIPFDFATCGGFCQPGAQFSFPRTNDLDPRVALAWAPAALQGKTVVRAGFGIYHGDGQLEDQNLPASNDQARYSLASNQIPGLAYPIDLFLATTPGILSPRAQNRNRKDEYSSQWGISLQQDLPLHITGTLSYTGNKGTDLQTITYSNILDPLTGTRPYPEFGQVEYRTNDSNSSFHAVILSAQRHLRSDWLVGANYMWSHAINDGSLGGGEADIISPQDPFCRSCERASSAQDIRNFFLQQTRSTVFHSERANGIFLSRVWRARSLEVCHSPG
jgi:carboxypeptidase family protein/TonB-dependent receptor-like protein